MRTDVLTVAIKMVTVVWNVAWYKCIDVQGYLVPLSSGSMSLSAVSLKRRDTSTTLHIVTAKKTAAASA